MKASKARKMAETAQAREAIGYSIVRVLITLLKIRAAIFLAARKGRTWALVLTPKNLSVREAEEIKNTLKSKGFDFKVDHYFLHIDWR